MNTNILKKTWPWAAGATVVVLGMLTTTLLFAQGMAPRKAARPAAGMAAQKPAMAAPMAAAGMAAGKATEKAPLIAEKDKKLELARVGDVTITVGQLAHRINRMSRYVRGRYQSLEKKRKLLDSMVEFEVLAKEAARRGFADNPDVVRMLRQVMIQRLRQRVVEQKVKRSDISEQDVKAYYKKHERQYNKPETVRVSHILVKDEDTAKRVLAQVKKKGDDPRAFRALVQKHSLDKATKRRAGDLRYFTRQDKRVPKPVIEAAFKLKKRGEVGGPVRSERGWHVIKLTHRRKEIHRKVDDPKVKQQIVTRILRERRREALNAYKSQLRKEAKVKIFEDRLADVKIDTTVQRRRRGWRGRGRRGGRGRLRRGRQGRRLRRDRRRRLRRGKHKGKRRGRGRRGRGMRRPAPMPTPMQ
jgi:peptidyl-prolyl cis-trans isomerase C